MLLDHGIDSFTAVLNNLILQRILRCGNNFHGMLAMVVSTMPFYFAVIEQYYTGELVLQVVNGVDDGSIVYIMVCFATAYYGAGIWEKQYSIFGSEPINACHILMYGLLIALTLVTIDK